MTDDEVRAALMAYTTGVRDGLRLTEILKEIIKAVDQVRAYQDRDEMSRGRD